ncbi:hypothetical protein LTS17_005941 [Exophiala oligosperma]
MSYQTPTGQAHLDIPELGTASGFEYASGVRQFCGIPYGRLAKRWTRAAIADSWENGKHDGTKLGLTHATVLEDFSSSAPNPPELFHVPNNLTPVPQFPHMPIPRYQHDDCLVMNITTPPLSSELYPVMVYVHGGAFIYGGANRSVFDGVNLVNYSIDRKTPVLSLALNYRVGIWGFLASRDIQDDLARDGFSGAGNFGLTDQRLAFEWIRKYIRAFGGDPDNVTIVGESAGGTSVAFNMTEVELKSKSDYCPGQTSGFHRAICMSGGYTTIPVMSMREHEKQYRALLRRLQINPDAPGALEALRNTPEAAVTACSIPLQGAIVSTYNPCDDGVLLGPHKDGTDSARPTFENMTSPPSWVKSVMFGDVGDEAVIFRLNDTYTYSMITEHMAKFLSQDHIKTILDLYGVTPELPPNELRDRFELMASDTVFRAENYVKAHRSNVPQTFGYHFDQPSTLDNPLKGTAYHAIDLLYLFRNLFDRMDDRQKALSDTLAGHFIDFSYGKDPWERFNVGHKWMVYGPDGHAHLKTEAEDEPVRRYSRTDKILQMGVYTAFADALDYVSWQRFNTAQEILN